MSEKMKPASFGELFTKACIEYRNSGSLFMVPVSDNEKQIPLGPAAGPHTQLAQNIVAAYAAGAAYFELKTVQVLYGDSLGIKKPCIYVGNEVYNTEWSSELPANEAADEYIKAFLLIKILQKELGLPERPVHFIMSVGYNLEGICSDIVDGFLNCMKDASLSKEWQNDIGYLKNHIGDFHNLTDKDIGEIAAETCISDTVTLSTMHGCPADEIEHIAGYLLEKKGLNTVVKMNPTIIGKEETAAILSEKGYGHLRYPDDVFDKNISMDNAVSMIKRCQEKALSLGKKFGVKMTNTFPVFSDGTMKDEMMYMSGPALFPLSIAAAAELSERLDGKINISYSGGADAENIGGLLACGIMPVTVSSVLLKPGGYRNLSAMTGAAESAGYSPEETIDTEGLKELSHRARADTRYDRKERHIYKRQDNYEDDCAVCHNCVDVCPNRANVRIEDEEGAHVIHLDRFCNGCGCCSFNCLMGHEPYLEKITYYDKEPVSEKLRILLEKGKEEGVI